MWMGPCVKVSVSAASFSYWLVAPGGPSSSAVSSFLQTHSSWHLTSQTWWLCLGPQHWQDWGRRLLQVWGQPVGYRVSPDQPGLQGRTLSQKKTKIQTKRNTCEGPICVSKFSIFTNNVAIFPFSLLENIATIFLSLSYAFFITALVMSALLYWTHPTLSHSHWSSLHSHSLFPLIS